MIQANPTVEQDVSDCPYCDRPIDGKSVSVGSDRLHPTCHTLFNAEMEEAFPEEKPAPLEPDFFPNMTPNFDDALCVF